MLAVLMRNVFSPLREIVFVPRILPEFLLINLRD